MDVRHGGLVVYFGFYLPHAEEVLFQFVFCWSSQRTLAIQALWGFIHFSGGGAEMDPIRPTGLNSEKPSSSTFLPHAEEVLFHFVFCWSSQRTLAIQALWGFIYFSGAEMDPTVPTGLNLVRVNRS